VLRAGGLINPAARVGDHVGREQIRSGATLCFVGDAPLSPDPELARLQAAAWEAAGDRRP